MNIQNPAGLWVRVFARVIDGILITVTLGVLFSLFYGDFFYEKWTWVDILGIAYVVGLPVLWSGYTLGKRAADNRIVRVDANKNVHIGTMLLREIISGMIYSFTFGIAVVVSAIMIGLRKDKRGIHDFIAGTYVTHNKPGQS
ncbi:RDD family protein [Halobacillus sp. HZG1]|uniref:RDD family protein n=1 Tax=Halobacillus sp. HZG1 TaxID=3111769 RepID=UPI002DBF92DE|nr:RDD family protein [Halobacillus sp. HZG1]MEC3885708.1 RDD family protein [Halobacillus sp. HZG1]